METHGEIKRLHLCKVTSLSLDHLHSNIEFERDAYSHVDDARTIK